jgi:hypothetical protein
VIRNESIYEVGRLAQCIAFGCSDYDKRCALCGKKRVCLDRSLPKAAKHRIDGRDECAQVGEQLRTEDLVEHSREETYSCADKFAETFAGTASWSAQDPNKFPIEERTEPFWCVKEVEGGT